MSLTKKKNFCQDCPDKISFEKRIKNLFTRFQERIDYTSLIKSGKVLSDEVTNDISQLSRINLSPSIDPELRSIRSFLIELGDSYYKNGIFIQKELLKLLNEFRTRWILWRIASPISMITGYRIQDILYGSKKNELLQIRRLVIWMTCEMTNLTHVEVGRWTSLDPSSVRRHLKFANLDFQDKRSYLSLLLEDVFSQEAKWSTSSHLRGPDWR